MNSFNRSAGILLLLCALNSCSSYFSESGQQTQQYRIEKSDSLQADSSLAADLQPFRDSLYNLMNQPVGYSASPMVKGLPESNLGNFVADVCQEAVSEWCLRQAKPAPDFTMLNNGGLRNSLPAGVITRGNIFEMMPFENELVIAELDAGNMHQFFTYLARRKGNPVSGIRLQLNDSSVSDVKINGLTYDSGKTFRFVTSDYLAAGGDNMSFLKNKNLERTGIKVRDAIFLYLEKHSKDTLKIQTDGRIRY